MEQEGDLSADLTDKSFPLWPYTLLDSLKDQAVGKYLVLKSKIHSINQSTCISDFIKPGVSLVAAGHGQTDGQCLKVNVQPSFDCLHEFWILERRMQALVLPKVPRGWR